MPQEKIPSEQLASFITNFSQDIAALANSILTILRRKVFFLIRPGTFVFENTLTRPLSQVPRNAL